MGFGKVAGKNGHRQATFPRAAALRPKSQPLDSCGPRRDPSPPATLPTAQNSVSSVKPKRPQKKKPSAIPSGEGGSCSVYRTCVFGPGTHWGRRGALKLKVTGVRIRQWLQLLPHRRALGPWAASPSHLLLLSHPRLDCC